MTGKEKRNRRADIGNAYDAYLGKKRTLNMLCESVSRKRLADIVDELPFLYKRKIAVKCPDEIKFEVIAELLDIFRTRYKEITDIDGVGISFGTESWVLIRASNTGPKIRITIEAESDKQVDELLSNFRKSVEDKIDELEKKIK